MPDAYFFPYRSDVGANKILLALLGVECLFDGWLSGLRSGGGLRWSRGWLGRYRRLGMDDRGYGHLPYTISVAYLIIIPGAY